MDPNEGMRITTVVLLSVAFGLGVYDIIIGKIFGYQATISWDFWSGAKRWPIIAFAMGVLMGHFFAQMNLTQVGR